MAGVQQLFSLFTGAALTAMIDLGFRNGLFDASALGGAQTSLELAARTGLQERYVREWLSALTTAGIFKYEPSTKKFTLSPEELTHCFQMGGGLSYEFFQDMDWDMNSRDIEKGLVRNWLPQIESVHKRLVAGEALHVLDIGIGKGLSTILMAKAFPNSEFFGFDISAEGISAAKEMAEAEQLKNVSFHQVDMVGEELADEGKNLFDLVVAIDVIHDLSKPVKVLQDIFAMIKPGGYFLMQELNASSHLENNLKNPMAPFLYSISTMHCLTVSLAGEDGAGFGTLYGRENFIKILKEAGFVDIVVKPASAMQLNFICKKPAAAKL